MVDIINEESNETLKEAHRHFAYTALLANEMLLDKSTFCPLHHKFWLRVLEERQAEMKYA